MFYAQDVTFIGDWRKKKNAKVVHAYAFEF
jgi:hypothetical protein